MGQECFICSKCGETRDMSFARFAKGKRHSWCKVCHSEAAKIRQQDYRKKVPRTNRIKPETLNEEGVVTCSKCGEPAPNLKSAGWCRKCRSELEAKRREKLGMVKRLFSEVVGNTKLCTKCKNFKSFADFYNTASTSDGLSTQCKECSKKGRDSEESRNAARKATAQYRLRNRDEYLAKHRINQYNRKHKIKAVSDGSIDKEFVKYLYAESICSYCLRFTEESDRTLDHVVALSEGGEHSASNAVMACNSCNSSKRSEDFKTFYKRALYGTRS